MTAETVFTNARLVTPDAVIDGSLCVRGGTIHAVAAQPSRLAAAVDLEGDYLIPGLVELHTDNLEKHFSPRPGVRWPAQSAVVAHDAEITAAGITTVFDALALGDVMEGSARVANLDEMAQALARASADRLLRADHHLHLRCEVSYAGVLELFHRHLDGPLVRLVSVMDHSPGQRQFASLDKYREYYRGKYGLSESELQGFIVSQKQASARYSAAHRAEVVANCRARGLPLASHDDATREHIAEAARLGMVIAEFPTTLEAARCARERGMHVMMGGPNFVRGQSHSGNVSARELARAGLLDTISSDYCPASALHAAFLLGGDDGAYPLPRAVATVTSNPARAAGLDDRGELAPGQRADLVRVRMARGMPLARQVWREGQRVA